jgi:hypothetical protein
MAQRGATRGECLVDQARSHAVEEVARQRALVVVGDDFVDQPAYGGSLGPRVEATATNEFTNLTLDNSCRVHRAIPLVSRSAAD